MALNNINILRRTYLNKFTISLDALEINERSLFHNKNFTIISNLPYNISSQLLIKWCILQNDHHCINEMILMFQKELGERILSDCNSKKYGSLSVLVQAFFNIKRKVIVSKECFKPIPKVESIVLHFLPLKKNRIKKEKFKILQKITKFFFNERRKKNKKKIEKLFNEKIINNHNLQKYFDLRAENLNKDLYFNKLTIHLRLSSRFFYKKLSFTASRC